MWSETAAAKAPPARLLFLFGAGASFGATHIAPCRPPLGADLYNRLAEAFPGTWGHFAHRADEFRRDFEAALDAYLGDRPTGAIFELDDMARYFERFAPDGADLYSRLLRALADRTLITQTVFCSLNYDCIFERAAFMMGYRVHYEAVDTGPVVPGHIRVVKPHGSCNFLTRRAGRPPMPYLMSGTTVEAGIEVVRPDLLEETLSAERAEPPSSRTGWPVMSNYVSNKSTPLSPGQICQVRVGFAERVGGADIVMVIGARPNEHDDHVWGTLSRCSANVLYVGGDYSKLRVARSRPLGETFEKAWPPLLTALDAIASDMPGRG